MFLLSSIREEPLETDNVIKLEPSADVYLDFDLNKFDFIRFYVIENRTESV